MAEQVNNTHWLELKDKLLKINGVEKVIYLSGKEVELKITGGKIKITGEELSAEKLAIAEGQISLSYQKIYQISYANKGKGIDLKGIFK